MSDSESISSDSSDGEFYDEEFLRSIPEDSDDEGLESASSNVELNTPTLKLEVGSTFLTWKAAFEYIKNWAHQQGFYIRKGRSDKVQNKRRKQTILCRCEGVYNNNAKKNKSKPSKTQRTNCKWHVNLSQPVKNNENSVIFVTTLFN